MGYMDYFDAPASRDVLIRAIRGWFDTNGRTSAAVIGMSGGADSTIVAALCAKALGPDRVYGLRLPNMSQPDLDYAEEACRVTGINSVCININDAYSEVRFGVEAAFAHLGWAPELSDQAKANLAPRVRAAFLYAFSQSIDGRVVGTSNLSETMTGYFTKWGDECCDVRPIAALTKTEVVAIGHSMQELPKALVDKTPSDGLSDRTDEEALGFSYAELDRWIRARGVLDPGVFGVPDALGGKITSLRIAGRVEATGFKRTPPQSFPNVVVYRRGWSKCLEDEVKGGNEP